MDLRQAIEGSVGVVRDVVGVDAFFTKERADETTCAIGVDSADDE